MVKATEIDCDCLNLTTCERVMKSVYKLPTFIGKPQFMTIDGSKNISLVERTTKQYALEHGRLGKDNPKIYIFNDEVYLLNAEYQALFVVADFEDEEEVLILNSKCSPAEQGLCKSALDIEMSGETIVIDRAITLALAEFIKTWNAGSEDNVNNAKSNDASREQEN